MIEGYEDFSDNQLAILEHYVTNTSSNVFALRNLSEAVKGALFSRYSRSNLGLRSLLLKEFIACDEDDDGIIGCDERIAVDQIEAVKKAQNFYDRILDGYGDDSIGELGGAHLAVERLSMLAAKIIEDNRIGGSPLEKSTRYVYFDQKVKGEYAFYREPILMTSAFRDIYLDTCNMLFDTYSKLIAPLTEHIEMLIPRDPETSQAAYRAAIRAKVLDSLRGLLPAGALTNMGVYGNGRFFEGLIRKLRCNNLAELQDLGKHAFDELSKVIPSFLRRSAADHQYQKSYAECCETMQAEMKLITSRYVVDVPDRQDSPGVRLVDYDEDAVKKVVAAVLFSSSDKDLISLQEFYDKKLTEEDIIKIIDAICNARENRRHKSPRALENAEFTFEIVSDFGCYRDLQRHRILTQERQLLSCKYGYVIPDEIKDTAAEKEYCEALDRAKEVYDTIAKELPEEAQYVVPMAYNIRWYFHINLRALQWMCELRSIPAGHSNYRKIAQQMARMVCDKFPVFERVFQFVDYEDYSLGRVKQEQHILDKR